MTAAVDLVPVRLAQRADLGEVRALLYAMHREMPQAPISESRLTATLEQVLARGAIFLTLDGEGRAVGTCGLLVDAPWWSEQRWVRDLWLFVVPAQRRTPHGRALLRAARRFAAGVPAPLFMEVWGGSAAGGARRVAAKIRLYRRELGEPSGATWVLEGGD